MIAAYAPERRAIAQLSHFVYHFYARTDALPKDIDPALVERWIGGELRRERPAPAPAKQMVELADYYDRRALVGDMRLWIDGKEASEDAFLTSTELTRGVAILGDAEARRFAGEALRRLVALPPAEDRMSELLACWVEVAPEESGALLAARLDALAARLRESPDPADRTQARELGDLRRNDLPFAEGAVKRRAEIAAIPDAAARLDRLTDIYLGLDLDYQEWLERWAVRRLLHEAATLGDGPVAEAFARALFRVDASFPDEAERAPIRACALHAMERFGGELTARERRQTRPRAKRRELLAGP